MEGFYETVLSRVKVNPSMMMEQPPHSIFRFSQSSDHIRNRGCIIDLLARLSTSHQYFDVIVQKISRLEAVFLW